ncbi:50S ribosomal protein L21 [bacterium]|nr:50S ribosomal protein L21 [bacterium]
MYAVIRSGGKQYRVIPGERLRVELLPVEKGQNVNFDVLAVHDGQSLHLGTPILDSASVTGRVTEHGKGKKIIVARFKRRKGFHKKNGHRQPFTEILIEDIQAGQAEKKAAEGE